MSLTAPTTETDFEAADTSTLDLSKPAANDAPREAVAAEDPAALSSTIAIELNFNAFADHVPPTRHARRVARIDDPSIQDFADQALEIAALRAELKRLQNDYENAQNAVRLRDTWLRSLREELAATQAQLRTAMRRISSAPAQSPAAEAAPHETQQITEPVVLPPGPKAAIPVPTPAAHDLTTTLDVSASQTDSAATLPKIPALKHAAPGLQLPPGRRLIPVDHEGDAVPLCRDIMTIGRKRENDICIPSRAVSRDHARLLIGPSSVTIVDMDSANGCYVNDEPVKRQKLRDGDIVRIGDRSYRFANTHSAAESHGRAVSDKQ